MKIAIIGAGFYGVSLALALAEKGHCITVFEDESNIMARASQANQARIHNGYHYTRS
ncbi:MAG: FAD-dependent oxidoreductase, partial [Bdellovibrionaceae bacterium]|nr:FAD-dependent oxidoreductase [Bdellovibrio sp.]